MTKRIATIKNKRFCVNGSDEMTTTYSFFWNDEYVSCDFNEKADLIRKIGDTCKVAVDPCGRITKVYRGAADKLVYGAIASFGALVMTSCFILSGLVI